MSTVGISGCRVSGRKPFNISDGWIKKREWRIGAVELLDFFSSIVIQFADQGVLHRRCRHAVISVQISPRFPLEGYP